MKANTSPSFSSVLPTPMTKRRERQTLLKILLLVLAIVIFIPVWMVITAAFSEEASISQYGFSLWPREWSLSSFRYVSRFGSQLVQSYKVTIVVTLSATALTLLLTSMLAFSLSRHGFQLRGVITLYLLITMIFSGGQLGSYLIYTNLFNLRNNLLVLILPGAVGAMNCFIMRSFILSNVPDAIIESAKIDGASDYRIFFQVVLPLMLPVMGAIGFMVAVGHWNEWQNAMLYINKKELSTLQQLLMNIETTLDYLSEQDTVSSIQEAEMLKTLPTESGRMALLLCALGPVLIMYPFFQKYFVKGLSLGSVK